MEHRRQRSAWMPQTTQTHLFFEESQSSKFALSQRNRIILTLWETYKMRSHLIMESMSYIMRCDIDNPPSFSNNYLKFEGELMDVSTQVKCPVNLFWPQKAYHNCVCWHIVNIYRVGNLIYCPNNRKFIYSQLKNVIHLWDVWNKFDIYLEQNHNNCCS